MAFRVVFPQLDGVLVENLITGRVDQQHALFHAPLRPLMISALMPAVCWQSRLTISERRSASSASFSLNILQGSTSAVAKGC